MAKWGEGDPRWIVEDRPDATNVNNWHWTMKDASAWSKGKLKDFLVGLKLKDPSIGNWNIEELSTVEGEASASNRKGNLIILYDWTIKAKIKGSSSDGKEDEGTINIVNFCNENEINDIEIDVSLDKSSSCVSKSLAKHSRSAFIENLTKYVTLLRNQYSQGVILPSHNKTESTNKTSEPSKSKLESTRSPSTKSNTVQAVKISTKKAELKELFKCSCEELYNVFVTEELVTAFTKSPATVSARKGGNFAMMNGQITGQFIELDRPNKIVKTWRSKNWPEGHYSNVTFQFQQKDDGTLLILKQTGIPESDHERTKEGWTRFVFAPIKYTFGYGAALF